VAPAGEQRADGPVQAVPKPGAAPGEEATADGQSVGTPDLGPMSSPPMGPGGQPAADGSTTDRGGATSAPEAHGAGTGGPSPDGSGTAGGGGDDTGGSVAKHDSASKHDRQWAFVRRALEVLVLGAAALFVLSRVNNVGSVAGAFDHLHWHWLFVGVGAEACSIVALAWMQHKLLRVGGLPVSVPDLVPVTLASNAVSLSLPAGTLFAEGYTFRQYQWLGASQVLAIWSQLSAGALATAALAAVAVAGAAIAPGLRLQLLPGLTLVLAGAVVAAALFRRAPLLGSLIGRTLRGSERFLPSSLCRHLRSAQVALRQMESFNPPPKLWMACFGFAALNWLLDAVVLTTGLLTVGAPVPWKDLLLCYAAAQVLVELPITPGGLGLVEGGLVEVLIRFHVPASLATAGTLVYRAVSYWLLLLVGWSAALYLTLRNRRASRAAAAAASAQTS
jgi:putative heme transporter